MRLVVTGKAEVATDVMRLRLVRPDGGSLPAFKPGAHVGLAFDGRARRYSLTSDPAGRKAYELHVLRASPGAGGSAYLHDALAVGDALEVSEPVNAFPLALDAAQSVFFAGGIGVTPFPTMTAALVRAGRPFELHHAVRDASRLLAVEASGGAVHRHVDRDGRPALDVGRLLDRLDPSVHLNVCGPRPPPPGSRRGCGPPTSAAAGRAARATWTRSTASVTTATCASRLGSARRGCAPASRGRRRGR